MYVNISHSLGNYLLSLLKYMKQYYRTEFMNINIKKYVYIFKILYISMPQVDKQQFAILGHRPK